MIKKFDHYASVVFLVIGIAVFMYIQSIEISTAGSFIGPKELPAFLAVVLIILSGLNLYQSIKSQKPEKEEKLEYKKFLIIFVSLVLYALLIEPLGYVISTFLFLMAGFQTMEKGGYLKSALISAAFAGGIYYLYVEIAKGVLPSLPF
ncbi:MAG: tripartite tricarboxylate transporter TctB family protein [Sporomusaceae bacterium]|nr:tripartite tricarboxylate transporter TctB family protein [Sporomusaceae bacterium]